MTDVLVVILAGLAVLVGMVLFRRRGPGADRAVSGGRPYAGSGLPGQSGPGPSGRPARTSTARILNQPVDPMVVAVVVALLGQNKKIQAIKELRESTRLGLADAKALVEAIAAGHRPPTVVLRGDAVDVTPSTAAPESYESDEPDEAHESADGSPADLAARARSLRSQGREIEAVRLVRAETGMGLADAQRFVRALG
ncbi:ribosomal protein L7/L12 [Actinopolymorpha singaporensis]|uniref:Ribosomal protein L7/L12 C-terminal domain-containing protein n=1 Tax=Actinopolymorpha singaporensis TaxID=117157 RepID=A0A1H1VL71_9ACTN|nr:ribosomal protein L7/L12 [Actinopolymorpha singaporensis]SDS84769.1 Ribosomal protein L7/L12 C-terminal domain-containing protein [Actinopolymorpha singaporensis]